MKSIYATVIAVQLCVLSVSAQNAFQNLNFEAANVTGFSPGANNVPTSQALPGWFTGGGTTWYDAISAGGALVSINDAKIYPPPLEGSYSVLLFGGDGVSVLQQTGLIPVGTQSMTVKIGDPFPLLPETPFVFSLGGQTINMLPVSFGSGFTLYGADISAFAGQNTTLSFLEPSPVSAPPSVLMLDNIVFSPNQIPEPETWALMLCGAGMLAWVNRKK